MVATDVRSPRQIPAALEHEARWLPNVALAAFFVASALLRPIIPTAETRYLSVAWEMVVKHSYLLLTLNFAPYYHKPPLFFWLIAGAWEIFGAHRWVAVGVMFLIAAATVSLTTRLAEAMFPRAEGLGTRMPWLVVGSVVFLIYSSLIYLDMLQTVFVLAFMLALLAFAGSGATRHAAITGLSIGLGVLTKGPVMLVHVIWPVLFYPWWRRSDDLPSREFYRGCLRIVLITLVPVVLWLAPVLALADANFLFNLLWKQTAGRISGSLEGAHPEPFWFYFVLAPLMFLPWVFAPGLIRKLRRLPLATDTPPDDRRMLRLLVSWLICVLLALSTVSGKQPHYLVPALPLLMILLGYFMRDVPMVRVRIATLGMIALFVVGQGIAALTVFDRLDLQPLASFMDMHPGSWAFAGGYQGEFSYLARLKAPIDVIAKDGVAAWQAAHPGGYVIVRTNNPASLLDVAFSHPAYNEFYAVLHAPKVPGS